MEIVKNKTNKSVRLMKRNSYKNVIEYSIEQFRKGIVPKFEGEFQVFDTKFPRDVDLRELAYQR